MDLDTVAAAEAFEFEPRMSASDALMWSIEKDPLLRSTIVFVTLLDVAPDPDRLRRTIDRATRIVPRLRQRVLGHPLSVAPPRWEVDPNFDLDFHLRRFRAAGTGTHRELLDMARPIAMQGFDRARPLWEFTVVEGLEDGRAALIGKVHHAITDGVGGVKLQMAITDLERDPAHEPPAPEAPEPAALPEYRRWIDALAYEGRQQLRAADGLARGAATTAARLPGDPVGVATSALRTVTSVARIVAPATEPMSPVMRGRSLSVHFDSLRYPLAPLKQAARLVKGHLNDAFVAGVAGGLHRYHAVHGHPEVPALRMNMPINIRTESTARRAGNQFVPARFPMPIDIDDPVERMAAIRGVLRQERSEPGLAFTDTIARMLNRMPTTATTALFGSMLKGVDLIATNVPGAPVPVYLAGARVEGQIALAPLAGAAVNIALLSYCDDVLLGINSDPAAVPDPEVLLECLRDGFEEILKLA